MTKSGISRYIPNIADTLYGKVQGMRSWPQITFLWRFVFGDKRATVAAASESFVASAPLILLLVLDYDQLDKLGFPLHEYFV
mgnify:CR=1 FL=1